MRGTGGCACSWRLLSRKGNTPRRKPAPPCRTWPAVPKARASGWSNAQRECLEFGNLVMEGRDIGTNVFPETDFKFYLDATLAERTARRTADGVNGKPGPPATSATASAPSRRLMIALGAKVINNSNLTSEQTSSLILEENPVAAAGAK